MAPSAVPAVCIAFGLPAALRAMAAADRKVPNRRASGEVAVERSRRKLDEAEDGLGITAACSRKPAETTTTTLR
jgi:hypothetical protein